MEDLVWPCNMVKVIQEKIRRSANMFARQMLRHESECDSVRKINNYDLK